jgi:hypothetical protein
MIKGLKKEPKHNRKERTILLKQLNKTILSKVNLYFTILMDLK